MLVRKIKYRWMLAAYWGIEVSATVRDRDDEVLPGVLGILNAVNELLRFFFLVEGRPFPYTKRIPHYASSTKLGKQLMPLLNHVIDLALGREGKDKDLWDRLDEAGTLLFDSDRSPDCRRFEQACLKAMVDAGVEPGWVEADFDNINELLAGKLGPIP